jgi:hypothetical protein
MYTMDDFIRDCNIKQFSKLTPKEWQEVFEALPRKQQRQMLKCLRVLIARQPRKPPKLTREDRQLVLQSFPPEKRLKGLSVEQIQGYLDQQLTAGNLAKPRKPRRKK